MKCVYFWRGDFTKRSSWFPPASEGANTAHGLQYMPFFNDGIWEALIQAREMLRTKILSSYFLAIFTFSVGPFEIWWRGPWLFYKTSFFHIRILTPVCNSKTYVVFMKALGTCTILLFCHMQYLRWTSSWRLFWNISAVARCDCADVCSTGTPRINGG